MAFPLAIELEFITPCFCAGADQSKAEIRVPSIRGQLRWWFRVLGGSPAQEKRVFGGVHGNFGEDPDPSVRNVPRASALVIRVTDQQQKSEERDLPRWSGNAANDPLGYLSYFASVSGETKGQRWKKGAFLSPGSRFRLHISLRQPIGKLEMELLERTLEAWTRLGSLGMRATRGFGALRNTSDLLSREEFKKWASSVPNVRVAALNGPVPSGPDPWRRVMGELGEFLKGFRKDKRLSGREPTVLGCSNPRLASALHLRPVWLKEGLLPVVYYTPAVLPPNVSTGDKELKEFFTRQ